MLRIAHRWLLALTLLSLALTGFMVGRLDAYKNRGILARLTAMKQRLLDAPAPIQAHLEARLPSFEFHSDDAPPLFVHLTMTEMPIPRDITRFLTLHLARPDGFDAGRPLSRPDDVALVVSDDGQEMRLVIPLSAFANSADGAAPIALDSPGYHSLRLSLTLPETILAPELRQGPMIIDSVPVPFSVLPDHLETVRRTLSRPRHHARFISRTG